MKVFEAVAHAMQLLEGAGVPNSRMDAERLLAFELGTARTYILAHLQDDVQEPCLHGFFSNIGLRAQRQPLQYLLGTQEFCGLDFEVTPDVLIPRLETEILVEEAVRHFSDQEPWVVDVGTGSGCIAISVAVALPGARLWGVDLSSAALRVAGRNAIRHRVSEKIQFIHGDLLSPLRDHALEGRMDCILSNPPYVAEEDVPSLQSEVRDWEPRMALIGGPSGLSIYSRLIPEAFRCLRQGGYFITEIGYNLLDAVLALFDQNWQIEAVQNDYNSIPRVVVAFKK